MTRVFRISGILLIVGLLVEAVSLQYNNALSFMGFIMVGGLLLFLGAVLFLYSLVHVPPWE